MEESPEFRRYFVEYVRQKLDGPLSSENLAALTARYRHLAQTHPCSNPEIVEVMEKVSDFLTRRPLEYRRYLAHRFPEEAGHLVEPPASSVQATPE